MQYITKPKSHYDNPDEKLSKVGCTVPFTHYEIHSGGNVSACCYSWLPVWVGNTFTDTAEEILNNSKRLRLQEDMKKGCFDDCNDQCPQLNSYLHDVKDKMRYWAIVPLEQLQERLDSKPEIHVYFSYDLSCNLQCPSCRNELILWKPDDPNDWNGQRIAQIHVKVKELVALLLAQGNRVSLSITGSGDPFARPLYWDYLVELASNQINPNLRVNLQTNGVMMTRQNWDLIKPLWNHVNYINLSVDAATEATYKIVRKNGNFKRLKKNIDDLDQMIMDGCFPNMHTWQTNIVVQRDNYRELKQFVEWQLTLKSKPRIWTNLLAQWYHMNDETFNKMAIWTDSHPNRGELLEIMRDPIFKNPQLNLGNLNSMLPKD